MSAGCMYCGEPWAVEPVCEECRNGESAFCSCGTVLEYGDQGTCKFCRDVLHSEA